MMMRAAAAVEARRGGGGGACYSCLSCMSDTKRGHCCNRINILVILLAGSMSYTATGTFL